MSTLHVTEWPAGQDVNDTTFVLVHGWGCGSGDWDSLISRFRELGRVITVDLPGSGKSASVPGPYTLNGFATKVADALRIHEAARPILVGHSAGCEVAVALAEMSTVGARAIIAVDPAYGFPSEARQQIRAVSQRLEAEDPRAVAVAYFQAIDGATTPQWVRDQHPLRIEASDVAMRESFREFAFGPDAFHFSPECEERHRRRTVPLLAFYRNATRGAHAQEFAARPEDRVIAREDAGHWLHHEEPERFFDELTMWLGEQAP